MLIVIKCHNEMCILYHCDFVINKDQLIRTVVFLSAIHTIAETRDTSRIESESVDLSSALTNMNVLGLVFLTSNML